MVVGGRPRTHMNTLPQAPAAELRQVPSPVPGRTARRFKGTQVRLSPHAAGHRGLKAGGRSPVVATDVNLGLLRRRLFLVR